MSAGPRHLGDLALAALLVLAARPAPAAGLAARLNDRIAAARPVTPRTGPARVLVTRTAAQARPLVEALRDRGLDVVAIPTIHVEPAPAAGPLDAAVRDLGCYAWVVITSPNGADATLDALTRAGAEPGGRAGVEPHRPRWAAVGSATAGASGGPVRS